MDRDWVRIVGTGLLALLNDYKGPPREVIEMYQEKIREVMDSDDSSSSSWEETDDPTDHT
jgi:hypothetical protein